jgi:hypothetical protein
MVEKLLKDLDSLICHEFPNLKIINHDAEQARKKSKEYGFSPYISLTSQGIKKEGVEITGKCSESSIEAGIKYRNVLLNYLKSQCCSEGKKTLIWRKRPEVISLFDREGYFVFSRLMVT